MVEVKLPDRTLSKMNAALERNYKSERRPHLGASSIGTACERRLWNDFHFISENNFSARSIKAIADGHNSEAVMSGRLRMVKGIVLETETADGKQFGFSDGHIGGSLDGKITGLHNLPKETHIWEHKCVNEKKFNALVKLVVADEDTALYNWDEQYFAQAQIYMGYFSLEWHYLTACAPGSRDETSCITRFDSSAAAHYIDRAERIIKASKPPPRISEDPSWYQCKICPHSDNCHGEQLPLVNCRSCAYSTANINGTWACELFERNLAFKEQQAGCDKHLMNPRTVPARQVDSGEDTDGYCIVYEFKSGTRIRNQNAKITNLPTTGG